MPAGTRRRLDLDLVRRGLAETRQHAQAAIAEGRVLVGGSIADRPSRLVAPEEPVELRGARRQFVGRGGEKLDAALGHFEIDVEGIVALDAGASTGGFTDCLLQRGARTVFAVDVGRGQLDARLRGDPRVVSLERTHVRDLSTDALATASPGSSVPVDLVSADLSFISLRSAVPVLCGPIVRGGGTLLLLVKPQFEVGRAAASKGRGVIRDPRLWLDSLRSVGSSLEGSGAVIIGAVASALPGASGNIEFFIHALAHAQGVGRLDGSPPSDRLFSDAVDAVAG